MASRASRTSSGSSTSTEKFPAFEQEYVQPQPRRLPPRRLNVTVPRYRPRRSSFLIRPPPLSFRYIVRNMAASSSRRPNLPTGNSGGPFLPALPQHLTSSFNRSTDSTGSEDSIRTQVPLPYHLPSSQGSAIGSGYSSNNYTSSSLTTPWVTPTLPAANPPHHHTSRPLNPYSSEFTPSSGLPQQGSQGFHQGFDAQQGAGSQINGSQQFQPFNNNYNGNNGLSFAQHAQNSMCQPPRTQVSQSYNSNANMYANTGSFGAPQLQPPFGASQAGPYNHFGLSNESNGGGYCGFTQNQPYNDGIGTMNSYGGPRQPYNAPGSTPYNAVGIASSYNAPGINRTGYQNGYQNNSYGPGTSGSMAGGTNSMNGMNQPFNSYNTRNDQTYGAFMYSGNRGNAASAFAKKPPSNLVTAPILETSYNGKHQHLADRLSNLKFGAGEVLGKEVKVASPKNDKDKGKEVAEDNGVPTPGPKPLALDLEFSSEPRKTGEQTPLLRSMRNQSIGTDPSKKNSSIEKWLKTPTAIEELGLRPKSTPGDRRIASPPKMLDLIAAGGKSSSALATINEGDPFVSTPQVSTRPMKSNPFQPLTAVSAPFSTSLVGTPPGMSKQFAAFTKNGTYTPTIEEVLDIKNLPFVEHCRRATTEDWGVIKITNIPYSVTRSEVLAFLGRNARIINEQEYEPIHIIMERVTSKTLDCYVEFINLDEAVNAVDRFETNRSGGRGGRLGQRLVEVELSSQEALMKDLFPKAKNVKWHGSRPEIIPRDPDDIHNSGFQGFVSSEELVMLVKHVEAPQRSPFSKECPQRPFECLISTLLKFPWYMVDYVTIEQRNKLHNATKNLICLLVDRINNETDTVNLSIMLLKRLWRAVLRCPGLTPVMKDDIVYLGGVDPGYAAMLGVPAMADHWVRVWTIGPKPGVPDDMLMWYINILRESAEPKKELTLADKVARGEHNKNRFLGIFGYFNGGHEVFHTLRLDLEFGQERLNQATLGDVARYEWAIIERALRQSLK